MKNIKQITQAKLPSQFGNFDIFIFQEEKTNKEHVVLIRGDVRGSDNVLVRIHSECLTGDVLGSMRCDCRDQLLISLEKIGRAKKGIILYLRQEGRGIGLTNKIKAYELQDQGFDTHEANKLLGFNPDERKYQLAVEILKYFKIKSINLITNNPEKLESLKKAGIVIKRRIAHKSKQTKHNIRYLTTKKEKFGHLINITGLKKL